MVLSDEEIERVMVWEGVLDVASALQLASDRYCALHRLLRRHHARDFGAPWGMERWTHKDLLGPLVDATIPALWIDITQDRDTT